MNDPRPAGLPEWAERLNETPLPLKLRIEDYFMLDEAGAFQEYARTELIDGEIYYMNAQHRPHARIKSDLAYDLRRAVETLGLPLAVFVEATIGIPPKDAPEPDIVLTSEPDGDGPVPVASVALIAEVADTSLSFDLGKKLERYALAGIPEYWIVDVRGAVIRQFWTPLNDGFADRRDVPFGEPIVATTIAGLAIATDRLG